MSKTSKMSTLLKRNTAIVLIAALVVGVGAYAWAEGRPEGPSVGGSQADKSQARPEHHRARRHLLRRAVHGDLVVRGREGFQTVSFDKGEVTAVNGSSITLKRRDGPTVTKRITDQTRFRGVEKASDIRTGDPAFVLSRGNDAVVVAQRRADRARRSGTGNDFQPSGVGEGEEQVPAA